MIGRIGWRAGIVYIVVAGLVFYPTRFAQAGWTGTMNSLGYGWASSSVTSGKGSSTAATGNINNPSASVPPAGYAANAALPRDASSSDRAQIIGSPGYIWQAVTVGYNGDGTDNTNITADIGSYDCPVLTMNSIGYLSNDFSGSVIVNASGTPGTGLLLRGYEFTSGGLPTDLDDLTSHGSLKFNVLLVGPFDLDTSKCTAVVIPFTTKTGHTNLYLVADGAVKSNPLTVSCPSSPVVIKACDAASYPTPQISGGCGVVQYYFTPPAASLPPGVVSNVMVTVFDEANNTNSCTFTVDTTAKVFSVSATNVTFSCSSSLVYPPPQITGGCGKPTLSYNPPAMSLLAGTTNLVTLTAVDQLGRIAQCTFTAIRQSDAFNGFYAPISGTGGTPANPLRTINLGSNIAVKFDDSCNGAPLGTGAPTLAITNLASGTLIGGGNFQYTASVWHINWDTSGLSKGVYSLTAVLQDGSKQTAFVQLK